MATPILKTVPKAPKGYDKEMIETLKSACGRLLEATGCIYKSDTPYIDIYCRSYKRWQQAQEEVEGSGFFDERLKVNDLYKFEADLAAKVRQNYRALEATILDRVKASQAGTGTQGGRVGVRQTPARDGVPQVGSAKKASSGGISWMDDIRKAG